MAKLSYKVWVEIEEFVNGEPRYITPVLPDSLGFFKGKHALRDAMAKVALVVNAFGIDPENSDSIKTTDVTKNPVGKTRCLTRRECRAIVKTYDRNINQGKR